MAVVKDQAGEKQNGQNEIGERARGRDQRRAARAA